MPRPPKDYSQPQPYTPAPPPVPTSTPQEIIRATWAEFDKIAAYLADPANATALVLQGSANDANQPD